MLSPGMYQTLNVSYQSIGLYTLHLSIKIDYHKQKGSAALLHQ